MATVDVFAGEWCDCDYDPSSGGFVFAVIQRPGRVSLYRSGADGRMGLSQSHDLDRWGLYLRAASDGAGNVCVALQDGRDRDPATGQFRPAIVVLFPKDGPPREIACPAGPAFGQNAVNVERIDGGAGWLVYVAASPTRYWVGELNSGGEWVTGEVYTWPATSQGFADGNLPMDYVRSSIRGLACPSTAEGISIGQNADDGPDRIRGLHQGVYFTAIPGTAFEPHLASDGQGRWLACARTSQGAALVALTPPFEPEQAPPEPPVELPNIPWKTDPTGVIEDIAEWLFSPNQGPDVHISPDGNVRFFCKSDEVSGDGPGAHIGEHWDKSDDPSDFNIGHLDDASTGRRVWNGRAVTPDVLVAAGKADLWPTLKLSHNWFSDGARLWMPRRLVSGSVYRYKTDINWNSTTPERPNSTVWPGIPIEIRVDVGYGRYRGKEVRARVAYVPDGNAEVNYYGPPNGFNAWIIAAGNSDPWRRHE